jgi:hypothetical protein
MFIFFGILPRINKSHAAEPRLGTPALERRNFNQNKSISQKLKLCQKYGKDQQT